jgi:hypothetical protein
MGGKASTERVVLDCGVRVNVSVQDYEERYTETNTAIVDACIQQYYNTKGGTPHITNHCRHLTMYFLLPLARQLLTDDMHDSPPNSKAEQWQLPFTIQ